MVAGLSEMQQEICRLLRQLYIQILARDRLLFVEGTLLRVKYLRLFATAECAAYDLHSKILCRNLASRAERGNMSQNEAAAMVQELADERHEVWLAHMQHRNLILEGSAAQMSDLQLGWLDHYYARCVALLHPDLHPEVTPLHRQQMADVTRAYQGFDVPLLVDLLQQAASRALPMYNLMDLDDTQLVAEKQRLSALIAENGELMRQVSAEFPYYLRPLLDSAEMCAQKRQQLDDLLIYLRAKLEN